MWKYSYQQHEVVHFLNFQGANFVECQKELLKLYDKVQGDFFYSLESNQKYSLSLLPQPKQVVSTY